jgi:hypothetical protein
MEPIIIVDGSEIQEGKLESVKSTMKELVEFAEANEPEMICYSVYLDESRSQVTVLQIHPDSASAELHMQVGAPLFRRFVDLLKLQEIDIYGEANPDLLDQLRRKAQMLGGATLTEHRLHAGFVRIDQAPG